MPPVPPLLGTYAPPRVRRGDLVACLYRDSDCRVTRWNIAPIPWPRVRAVDRRGGSGVWVNEEVARAILTESAAALMYWFGVGAGVVWRWRRTFGVGGAATTSGSRAAHQAAARAGAAGIKAKVWTDEERDRKSAIAKASGTCPGRRWTPDRGGWTAAEVKQLGVIRDDAEVARRTGRSRDAVRAKRRRLGQ